MLSQRTLQRHLQMADLPGRLLEVRPLPDAKSPIRSLMVQGALLAFHFTPDTPVSAAQRAAGRLAQLVGRGENDPVLTFEAPGRWYMFVDLVEPFDPLLCSLFQDTLPVPSALQNPPRPWVGEWMRLNRALGRKGIRATLETAYAPQGGAGLGFLLLPDARLADAEAVIAILAGFKSTERVYSATIRGGELSISRLLHGRRLVRKLTPDEAATIDWGEQLLPKERLAKWFLHNDLPVEVSFVRRAGGVEAGIDCELVKSGPLQLRDLDRLSAMVDREVLGQPWEWFLGSSERFPTVPPMSGHSADYSLVRGRHRSISCGPLQAGVAAAVRRWEREAQLLSITPFSETRETVYSIQFPESLSLERVERVFDRMQSELPWQPGIEGLQAHGRGRISAQFRESKDWRWGAPPRLTR